MAKLKITELPEESLFSCPQCSVLHTRGLVYVEVEHEGQAFVYAELTKCCADPSPVPVLFPSRKSALEVLDRLGESIRKNTSPFFQLPLVSKKVFFVS